MVEASETGAGTTLSDLLDLLKTFGLPDKRIKLAKSGSSICPESTYINRDLDFRLTQISDCVIVSTEISPAGVINLVSHCWGIVIQLLQRGLMCRGYITRGPIFHTDTQIIGTGYQKAYQKEAEVSAFKREADERGTPFVEIDRTVCDYVATCQDSCVTEMFSRYVSDDGEVVALFPFKRFAHSFPVAGFGHKFDPDKEKRANDNVRAILANLKQRVTDYVDASNPDAVRKAEHYIRALDAQCSVCDRTEEMINLLASPAFPVQRLP